MSRIKKAFENGKAFIPFLTGGDPDIATTEKLIFEMEANGADLIEIGVPFSDPIAEGVVIQAADERALSGGVTTDDLFAMVKRVRCQDSGIDGIIIPDLPFEESDEIRDTCRKYGIDLINMIAPTSEDRIERIAKSAEGFLYCVSSLGVTGVRETITTNVAAMIEKVRTYSDIPCAIGFGISNPKQAKEMAAVSDGVIVGSAIVRIIAEHGKDSAGPVGEYVKSMKEAANS